MRFTSDFKRFSTPTARLLTVARHIRAAVVIAGAVALFLAVVANLAPRVPAVP